MNAATNITHLLWAGRWIEVNRVEVMGEGGWRFKCGRDAGDWLTYRPSDAAPDTKEAE